MDLNQNFGIEKVKKSALFQRLSNEDGGIVIPVILWWMGVPLVAVLLLWLLFFR